MAIAGGIYNALFKRSSTYFLVICAGAFILEAGIDKAAEFIFNERNKGKLWHHIKDNYARKEEE